MPTNVELEETLREKDFKLRCFGVVLKFLMGRAKPADRSACALALFGLTLHTRGEKPLLFKFDGQDVKW